MSLLIAARLHVAFYQALQIVCSNNFQYNCTCHCLVKWIPQVCLFCSYSHFSSSVVSPSARDRIPRRLRPLDDRHKGTVAELMLPFPGYNTSLSCLSASTGLIFAADRAGRNPARTLIPNEKRSTKAMISHEIHACKRPKTPTLRLSPPRAPSRNRV